MDVSNLLLEYLRLDRKRTSDGLSVAELARWSELKEGLNRQFSPGLKKETSDRRDSVRVPTRLACAFDSLGSFQDALITNLSRGGIFVATTAPLPVGTRLQLRIHIDQTGSELDVAGVVVTNHVGPTGTREPGMGIRFSEHVPEILKQIDDLYERSLQRQLAAAPPPDAPDEEEEPAES